MSKPPPLITPPGSPGGLWCDVADARTSRILAQVVCITACPSLAVSNSSRLLTFSMDLSEMDVFSASLKNWWTNFPWTNFPSGRFYRGRFFRGPFFHGPFFRGRFYRIALNLRPSLLNGTPYSIIHGIKIWTVWEPHVKVDEVEILFFRKSILRIKGHTAIASILTVVCVLLGRMIQNKGEVAGIMLLLCAVHFLF